MRTFMLYLYDIHYTDIHILLLVYNIYVLYPMHNECSCSPPIRPPYSSKKGVRHSPTGIIIIHLLLQLVSIYNTYIYIHYCDYSCVFCMCACESHLWLLNFRPDFIIYLLFKRGKWL